jgi:hypothetical protein
VTTEAESRVAVANRPRRTPMSTHGIVLVAVLIALMFALPVGTFSSGSAHSAAAPVDGRSTSHVAPSVSAPSVARAAAVHPASSNVFNPPCYQVYVGSTISVCVSIANVNESDIIPAQGSFVSLVEPNWSTDIPLIIKSTQPLNFSTQSPHSGPDSPIALNVTGTLWNGDPYYSTYDADVWHSNNPSQLWSGPTHVTTNKSGYTWWYNVTISAKASNGAPNFYPGMTVNWWIALTFNNSGTYTHVEGPHFRFTYSGAWPYSPYPGSGQFAGGSATFEDVNLTVAPRSPNWNDSVKLVLNTTQADVLSNATIASAYADIVETSSSGAVIQTGTIPFATTVTSNFGVVTAPAEIPPAYSQVEGAIVTYTLTIFDVASDQLVTPPASYTVGGNGSFLSGIFVDDLNLETSPTSVAALSPLAVLNPGQQVNLTLVSRNTGTAISAAEAIYTVSYPLLHEQVTITVPFVRQSSTIFTGQIPGLPIGSFVNFTVDAWDFTERLEISPMTGYLTPDFATYQPFVPGNSTFFYVFVYDNGSHNWVTGAKVQIVGPGGFFNSVGNTTFGVAYPNETRGRYTPLLVPANSSYSIQITDPYFVPSSGPLVSQVNVTVPAVHSMNNRQTLATTGQYIVVQEGNSIVFWLNTTSAPATVSPQVNEGVGWLSIAGIVGVAAIGLASIPLALWWRQIRARRKEEEKRVTL